MTAATITADHLGPALREVAPDDTNALDALFAEQRARLAVVRDNRIWDWLGDVPSGFGIAAAQLYGVYLQIVFVVAIAATLIVAGFTRGPVLWCVAATAPACLLLRELVLGMPARATLRLFRRGLVVPAAIVARAADPRNPELDEPLVLALLRPAPPTAASFRALLAAAEQLRAAASGDAPIPAELAAAVASIRTAAQPAAYDGSRITIAANGLELARVFLRYGPGADPASRVTFVLADPRARGAGSTRMVQPMLWGEGGESLCRALPWRRS